MKTFARRANDWGRFDRLGRADPWVIALMVGADLFFIVMHLIQRRTTGGFVHDVHWGLDKDHGFQESFFYVVLGFIVYFLVRAWRRTGALAYLAWASAYFVILVDDSTTIHESVGRAFEAHWNHFTFLGLRAQDYGELASYAVLGGLCTLFIAVTWIRSSARVRIDLRLLLSLMAMLVFCGIIVDMMTSGVSGELTIIEDGGEMIAESITLLAALVIWREAGRPVDGASADEIIAALDEPTGAPDRRL